MKTTAYQYLFIKPCISSLRIGFEHLPYNGVDLIPVPARKVASSLLLLQENFCHFHLFL